MTFRDRILLVLGFVGAIGLVVYPLAHRLATSDAQAGLVAQASAAPAGTATIRPTASPIPTRSIPTTEPLDLSWFAQAGGNRAEDGGSFDYECSPGGVFGQIWGTDIYTDDTSVCTAGVHAGVITRDDGGTVTIIIRPGQDVYAGSVRHGVESQPYGKWDGSFEVIIP